MSVIKCKPELLWEKKTSALATYLSISRLSLWLWFDAAVYAHCILLGSRLHWGALIVIGIVIIGIIFNSMLDLAKRAIKSALSSMVNNCGKEISIVQKRRTSGHFISFLFKNVFRTFNPFVLHSLFQFFLIRRQTVLR